MTDERHNRLHMNINRLLQLIAPNWMVARIRHGSISVWDGNENEVTGSATYRQREPEPKPDGDDIVHRHALNGVLSVIAPQWTAEVTYEGAITADKENFTTAARVRFR